jgi:uncharacterized phage infection (PIP) family protein YhgE
MSEEQINETTQVVNNELTERVNNAYIANNYTLLNGGTENVIMISGDKNDTSADMLLTLEGMEEVSKTLRAEADNKPESSDGNEE